MKFKYLQLFLWHTLFHMLIYNVQEALFKGNLSPFTDWKTPKLLYIEVTGLIAFYIYSLGAYWILFRFYKQKWIIIGILFALNLFTGTTVRYFLQEVIAPYFLGFRNYVEGYELYYYFFDNFYYAFIQTCIGCVFFFVQFSKYKESQNQALIIENQKTQLAYLRSQINPHFLFNTLNNIYSLVYRKSDKALQSVEKLTAMLRYGLYEKAEKVPLQKELEHLYNFIELEKLRYDFPVKINMEIEESNQNIDIPPFLLIPFIENAFKHGDLSYPIDIQLDINEKELIFKVKNKIKAKQKDQVGGIGLENIRKRLELIYGKQQTFNTYSSEDIFEVELSIKRES